MEGLEREKLELKRDLSAANSELRIQVRENRALAEKVKAAERSHKEVRCSKGHTHVPWTDTCYRLNYLIFFAVLRACKFSECIMVIAPPSPRLWQAFNLRCTRYKQR